MTTNTAFILKATHLIFWILFFGLCIQTGAMLISFFVSLFINAEGAKNLYLGLDLAHLYAFDIRHYIPVVSIIISLSALKAYIAFLVVKLFQKFNFSNPFHTTVISLISTISHFALVTGVLAIIANGYSRWLYKKGIAISQDWGSSEFLFLAAIIFIIAEVFKKGYEIKTENDLTV